ncbi:hypothetical protein MFLAVUS_005705 [Mucor flavus]|uniref:Uncharacterized protein n=1 Tax=Mucor flavus TaxID=439312 RepID=A0ABP9YZJ4_9FUNG
MCFPTLTAVGSLFLLCSFIIELFILIGNLPSTFLPHINFAKIWNRGQNQSYSFGLWNYCTGGGDGVINSCGSSSPAYNWANTPNISSVAPQAHSGIAQGLFLGMFILFFLGCGFSFVFWCFSLPICCLKRKGYGYSMSSLVLTTFLVMLTAFILSLVVVFLGMKTITNLETGWSVEAGNSIWLTIAALVSLLISFLCYTGGVTCGGKKRRNKNSVDPNYNSKFNNNIIASQPLYAASPVFAPQEANQTTGPQGTMLQQPYSASPNVGNQNLSPHLNQGYDTTTGPNHESVPMQGYQTPTLQPANAR